MIVCFHILRALRLVPGMQQLRLRQDKAAHQSLRRRYPLYLLQEGEASSCKPPAHCGVSAARSTRTMTSRATTYVPWSTRDATPPGHCDRRWRSVARGTRLSDLTRRVRGAAPEVQHGTGHCGEPTEVHGMVRLMFDLLPCVEQRDSVTCPGMGAASHHPRPHPPGRAGAGAVEGPEGGGGGGGQGWRRGQILPRRQKAN